MLTQLAALFCFYMVVVLAIFAERTATALNDRTMYVLFLVHAAAMALVTLRLWSLR